MKVWMLPDFDQTPKEKELTLQVDKFYRQKDSKNKYSYPNSLLITTSQLSEYLIEALPEFGHTIDPTKIDSIAGLKIILTDYLESPRLLRL